MRKILVFVDKDCLSATKVDIGVTSVSFCGENYMPYDSTEALENFKQCLLADLGLKTLADDELDILFLDCGAGKKYLDYLYNLCQDAAKVNVVCMEKVLPWLLWNKKQLRAGETIKIGFDSQIFDVYCNEDGYFSTKLSDGECKIEFEPEDFAVLFELDSSKMTGSMQNSECRELVDHYKRMLVKCFTNDEKVLNNLSSIAFEQADLDRVFDDDLKEIYLCNNRFLIPLDKTDVKYIGIGDSTAEIRSEEYVDFVEKSIIFENVRFDEKYQKLCEERNNKLNEVKGLSHSGNNTQTHTNNEIDLRVYLDANGIESNKLKQKGAKGSILKFGKWNNEDISWEIIDKSDNKALLLSEYILERIPFYGISSANIWWENSYVRIWLNSEFFPKAFNQSESRIICDCFGGVPFWDMCYAGQYSKDKVFLLSADQFNDFLSDKNKIGYIKSYSHAYKRYENNNKCTWWLRTSAIDHRKVQIVDTFGCVVKEGEIMENYNIGVRPACWVDLRKLKWY